MLIFFIFSFQKLRNCLTFLINNSIMLKSTIFPLILLTLIFTTSCKNEQTDLTNKISALQTEIDQLKATATESTTGFIHTVYFYAAEGLTEERKKDFMENALPELAKITSIQKLYYGPPAGTDREVVDNDYMLAWICHFKSSADHDAYQVDPIHLKFIEEYKDVWGKVLVYDNLLVN